MPTSRLFVRLTEKGAGQALDIMATRFEDEGFPLASSEVDETNDIWEASLYLDAVDDGTTKQLLSECLAETFPDHQVQMEVLEDIDWVSHSLTGLKPVRAGRFVVHGSHDRDAVRVGDIGIEIDAAQAFGTGHHGTTAGCLEMLEKVVTAWPTRKGYPSPILDLGTGSGVLAIAAARLVPAAILATDIDPVATKVALENMRINKVGAQVRVATAAGFHSTSIQNSAPFDLIIANILARPLMRMAPEIAASLSVGGSVILSGILAEQRWKVLAAFNTQGLSHVSTLWRNGWVTLHLR